MRKWNLLLLLAGVLCGTTHAYPVNPFNTKHLLNASGLVCYGRVISIKPHDIAPDTLFRPAIVTEGAVATFEIISIIKGDAKKTIDDVFRKSKVRVEYTGLVEKETCILFLKDGETEYRFVDDHNGKMEILPHEAIAYKTKTPEDRMVEELILGSSGEERHAIRCVKELGNIGTPDAVARLAELSKSPDLVMQGTAYAGLINSDILPDAPRLIEFFKHNEDTQSLKRFKTTGFSNAHLKNAILYSMNARLRVGAAAEKWKTFDLISFLRAAMESDLGAEHFAADKEQMIDIAEGFIADMIAGQIDEDGKSARISKKFRFWSREIVLRILRKNHQTTLRRAEIAVDQIDR